MKKIEMDKSDVIWDKILVILFFIFGLTLGIVERDVIFIIINSLSIIFRLVDFSQVLKK